MSCNAWQDGSIKLPTAEVKKVRDGIRSVVVDTQTLFYNKAQEFWKSLTPKQKRDSKAYTDALNAFLYPSGTTYDYRIKPTLGIPENRVKDFHDLMTWYGLQHTNGVSTPKRIQKPDVIKLYGKVTGANFTIDLGSTGGRIQFTGRTISYSADDNHGCDAPYNHFIAKTLWSALDRVNWTRGSGGQIRGNDEYNEDSGRDYAGGGGSYVVNEWGPKIKKFTPSYAYNRW